MRQTDRLALCPVADVGEDQPVRHEREANVYAIFKVGSEYFVIDDRCSHGPGSLSEGYVEGGEVECPFHQGRFDIRTGCPTSAPCTKPVRTWSVVVIDGLVTIDPCEEALCKP